MSELSESHIKTLLKNFPKEKFVEMSGLALLCGATVFALSGDPSAALLGSVGSNVLAATLQKHFEKVGALPTTDERERLAAFAQSLTPDIRRNGRLRKEVGDFLQQYGAVEIATAIVAENPTQGWLLTRIYSEVLNYRDDFERIHASLARLEAFQEKEADDEALRPYLKMVARRSERLPLAPLDPGGGERVNISLRDVFVSLKVQESLVFEEIERGGKTWTAVSSAAVAHIHTLKHTILLGDAGSGKSTLLRHLSYCLAKASLEPEQGWLTKLNWQKGYASREKGESLADFSAWVSSRTDEDRPEPVEMFWQAPVFIPVLVELREFARSSFDPQSPHALWRYVEQSLTVDEMANAIPALKKKAQQGKLLFLFDGVDEVATERRADVWRAIAALWEGPYGGCRWIATCRVLSFVKEEAPPGAPTQTIQPLDQEQIDQFIEKWTEALRQRGELTTNEAETFLESLQEATRGRLQELAPNPMLLTIIVLVQKYHGTLPKERAKLYDACVETMMLRWQQHKEKAGGKAVPSILTQLGISKEDFERLLWELAWQAHRKNPDAKGTADIAEADILRVARKPRFFNNDLEKIGKFINYTKERAHLLSFKGGVEEPLYTFPHRTFQEFLAARSLLVNRRLHRIIGDLAATGPPWREVLNLAAGILVFNENKREAAIGLVETVLPPATPTEEAGWYQVWLAGEMAAVVGRNWLALDEVGQEILPNLRAQLAALLTAGALTPQQRAEAGTALSLLGDPRPGVGLDKETGLPDIAWSEEEIPAGTYTIGGKYGFEVGNVSIARPYRLARYPITNVQFQRFVNAPDRNEPDWWQGLPEAEKDLSSPRFPYANHPRETVSWYQAIAFCRWLTAKLHAGELPAGPLTGDPRQYVITLPHEYEWEAAARWPNEGVQERIYPWGDEFDATKANTGEGGIGRTSAVGMYSSGKNSALDLYDLSGNVWEWCLNRYDNPDDDLDPGRVNTSGSRRVRRGGSFLLLQLNARASPRDHLAPDARRGSNGFRVVVRWSLSHPDH